MTTAIYGVAIDAGSGLQAALKEARGESAQANDLLTFKRCVIEELGTGASDVLIDAATAERLVTSYPPQCRRMIAYEADVYHIADDDRITVFPDNLSLADYAALGSTQLKFFIYYAPDDNAELNQRKQALVEQLGHDCKQHNLRFLMEPLVYHPTIEAGGADYAKRKPDLVQRATSLFAEPRFQVDVLKVEVPVDLNFVDGFGEPLMSRADALQAFHRAALPAADLDLVYLSAGVSFDWFKASLSMAREAGVAYNGFMCGRALWSDAIAVFGSDGETAVRQWLRENGQSRLAQLISAVQ